MVRAAREGGVMSEPWAWVAIAALVAGFIAGLAVGEDVEDE